MGNKSNPWCVCVHAIHFSLTQNSPYEHSAEEAEKEEDPAEKEGMLQLSRAEAKQAWLTAGGDTERAARQALRDRLCKVQIKTL